MAIYLSPDGSQVCNGVVVKEYSLIKHNPNNLAMPAKRTKKLKGITIHNTDPIYVTNTTMAEQYTRATVNGNMKDVRVHYYVDAKEAWQNLPLDYQSWHAADGSGDGNTTTISIEVIMGSQLDTDAEINAARLVAYLLMMYDLDISDVYTHTYWLNNRDGLGKNLTKDEKCTLKHQYKTCPLYIIPHWQEFLDKVKAFMSSQKKSMFYVQVGAFTRSANAYAYLETVHHDYPDSFVKHDGKMYYVQVGAFKNRDNADAYLTEVKQKYKNAFVKEM